MSCDVAERDQRERRHRREDRDRRRQREQEADRGCRAELLLGQQLEDVRERLQRAVRADAVGAVAALEAPEQLALGEQHDRHELQADGEDHDRLDDLDPPRLVVADERRAARRSSRSLPFRGGSLGAPGARPVRSRVSAACVSASAPLWASASGGVRAAGARSPSPSAARRLAAPSPTPRVAGRSRARAPASARRARRSPRASDPRRRVCASNSCCEAGFSLRTSRSWPSRAASSAITCQPARVAPACATAWRTRWTRPSGCVTVPSFSA